MARFDVFQNSDGAGYLLDVQADLMGHLNTRVVVPLLPPDAAPKQASGLNPAFEVVGLPVVMVTQFLAAVPVTELRSQIGNLAHHRDDIVSALDMLFQGF